MKWISVKDRLPPKGDQTEVVFYVEPYAWETGMFTPAGLLSEQFDNEFERYVHNCDGEYYEKVENVTHWMPLPEPPEDGEKFRTVKPAPIESTNFTRDECMAAIVKVDEITKRRQAKPDYELEVYITGVRIGDSGKTQWHISLDDDVDTLQAIDILEKATEVLRTNSEPPEDK